MNESSLVSVEAASKFIASIIADYDWFLKHMKSGQEHLPTKIRAALVTLAVEDYSKHYLDENSLTTVFWEMLKNNRLMAEELGAVKLLESNQGKPLDPLVEHLSKLDLPEDSVIDDLEFSEDDRNSDTALMIKWMMLWLHEVMALMVHGVRITILAKKSN